MYPSNDDSIFFSFIIPVYNVEKYLNQCVESIRMQTFSNFEVILVDDGSSDSSGSICDDYQSQDNRIHVIHKKNGGASSARNAGLDAAKGVYTIFLDSDDYIDDIDFLQQVHDASQGERDIVLYTYRKYYESSGKMADAAFHLPPISENASVPEIIQELVKQNAFFTAAWLRAIRTSLLKDNDICFVPGIRSEDQEWYYHVVLKAESYAAIDKAFVVYRQRENSVTSTFSEKHFMDTIQVLHGICEMVKDCPDVKLKDALLSSIARLYVNLMIALGTLDREAQNRHMDELKSMSWLLRYDMNSRVRKVKLAYKVIGINGVIFMLNIVQSLRRIGGGEVGELSTLQVKCKSCIGAHPYGEVLYAV